MLLVGRAFAVALVSLISMASLLPASVEKTVSGCTHRTSGYEGVWSSPKKGEQDISYRAPDQLLIKDRSSSAIHSVDGTTVWDYDPTRHEAIVTYNEPMPFGHPIAPSLLPGADSLRRHLLTVADSYRIALDGTGTVAGRRVFKLRLTPTTPEQAGTDKILWVDRATCLVLQQQSVTPDGQVIGGTSGFTTIRYGRPQAGQLRMPPLPDDTFVTTNRYGSLKDLAAGAGFPLVEPSPLPKDWTLRYAKLTIYPDRGTGAMKVLSWYYDSGDRTRLAVTAWSPPRLRAESRGDVLLDSGITGHFFTDPFNEWGGIQWVDGTHSFNLSGPGLSDPQLVDLANSMITSIRKPGA